MDNIAEAIQQSANSGGQRVSIGRNPTFGPSTIPVMFPSLIPQMEAESLSFHSVDIFSSGSAAVVTAGSAKPTGATVSVTARSIGKIAAIATINTEIWWESTDVIQAIISTLYASCASEEDKVANESLASAAEAAVPQASWIAAIADGQSKCNAAGGSPNLVIIPSTVWPALAGEIAASNGLSTPSSDAILSILGSRIVLSPEGTAAFVLDPNSCIHAVRDSGFIVDAFSGGTTNTINVIVDLVASTFVQIPQHVIAIAKSP